MTFRKPSLLAHFAKTRRKLRGKKENHGGTKVQNILITLHKSLIFPRLREWASERASKQMSVAERANEASSAKPAVHSKQCGANERANERANGRVNDTVLGILSCSGP